MLKLVLSCSSFQLGTIFELAITALYKVARNEEPFKNEAQFLEAVELHDELIYEFKLKPGSDEIKKNYKLYKRGTLDLVFERHESFFSTPSPQAE